jgi:RNA polymerase sigma-70 factor (ECF subfamily)
VLRRDEWDEAEFTRLFNAVYPGMARYLECLLGQGGAAQEAAQEAFVRLYRLGPGRVTAGEERFWLYRVATNLARNELRRARLRERLASAVAGLFGRRKSDPHADAERADAAGRLLAALGRLPEHQRVALLLREQEGLTYAEIAEALGVSLAKVKVDIFRARTALRADLLSGPGAGALRAVPPNNGKTRYGM